MSGYRIVFFLAFALLGASVTKGEGVDSGLVSLLDDKNMVIKTGEIIRENEKAYEIQDIHGKKSVVLKTYERVIGSKVSKSYTVKQKALTEEEAVAELGLSTYFSWQIERHFPIVPLSGKVAKVEGDQVFVTVGTDKGASVGQELVIFRSTGELKDPDTGKAIGEGRREIAKASVIDVAPTHCAVKLTGKEPSEVNVGDEVRANIQRNTIAVLPLVDVHGGESDIGKKFSEELTTALVRRKLPLVERTLIDTVLQQIKTRSQDEFDKDIAVKFGKLLGATYIICGTTDRKEFLNRLGAGFRPEMYVRLIKVETGDILYAAQQVNENWTIYDMVTSGTKKARSAVPGMPAPPAPRPK